MFDSPVVAEISELVADGVQNLGADGVRYDAPPRAGSIAAEDEFPVEVGAGVSGAEQTAGLFGAAVVLPDETPGPGRTAAAAENFRRLPDVLLGNFRRITIAADGAVVDKVRVS